jgi:hypothetical protein
MERTQNSSGQQAKILADIGRLADKVRDLRQGNAIRNETQIKALSADLRGKWEELRLLRAGHVADTPELRRRGHYE